MPGDFCRLQPYGLPIAPGVVETVRSHNCSHVENVPAFESVLEIRSGHRDIAHPTQRVFCTESNQSLWIVQPAGIQKNRIHYAEDGYIRANTKSERKNRSYRECRRLAQLAQSITKFLNNSAHSQSFIRPVFAEQLCPSEHV